MTTIFVESGSTDPPLQHELLDASTQAIKNDLEESKNNRTDIATLYTVGGSGNSGPIPQQVLTPTDATGGLSTVPIVESQDVQRFSFYPAATAAVQAGDNNQGSGQFYVMMSPQEVIPVSGNTVPRIIAPRSQDIKQKVEPTRTTRDEKRRATHNEVERRRRDRINTWIMKMAAVIPDCQMDQSKQGTSKGGVLSKALDHIIKLRGDNDRMHETIKEQERILVENQVLRQQVEKLRQENAILQSSLLIGRSDQTVVDQQSIMEAE